MERNNIAYIEGENMIYQYSRRERQMTQGRWWLMVELEQGPSIFSLIYPV
jgi:hypothetical protein